MCIILYYIVVGIQQYITRVLYGYVYSTYTNNVTLKIMAFARVYVVPTDVNNMIYLIYNSINNND